MHSRAGLVTQCIAEYYNFTPPPEGSGGADKRAPTAPTLSSSPSIQIILALGTHAPMTPTQINSIFGKALAKKRPNPSVVHNWREDVVAIGHAPSALVARATVRAPARTWPP